jgi:hypothetical protein
MLLIRRFFYFIIHRFSFRVITLFWQFFLPSHHFKPRLPITYQLEFWTISSVFLAIFVTVWIELLVMTQNWLSDKKSALQRLTLSLLMSYIYGAPCTASNFNVVYIYGPTFGKAESRLFLFAAQCINIVSTQKVFLCHSCVQSLCQLSRLP